ncbi:zinc finger, CCHC-type containing protein [Tanacetum coccineum]
MSEDSTRWGKYADRLMEMHRSRPIEYHLKSEINKKTIEDLVDNHKYNDSLLATCLGNMDSETYKSLPIGSMYDTILIQKLARKKGWEGNFVISCSVGKLKYLNALVDQGSDVNIMPLTIYNKLHSEKPMRTNIRLSLANHSYVYPEGIAEDVLIDVAGFVYPAKIKCRKGSMTLIAGKFKVRRILEWEERVENFKDGKIEFSERRGKVFNNKNLGGHNFFIYDHELEKNESSVSVKGVM